MKYEHEIENNLLSFLSHLNDIVIFLNLKQEVIECNLSAENFYSCRREELLGTNFFVFCKNHNFECPYFIETSYPISQFNPHEFYQVIEREPKENDKISWEILPTLDSEKKLNGLLLIGKDTLQKKINFSLKSFIEQIPCNCWIKDIHGRYQAYSLASIQLLGLKSLKDIIGKTDYEMPWTSQADVIVKNDKNVIAKGKAELLEEEALTVNGDMIPFIVVKAPMRDELGNIIGTIGAAIDSTLQKKGTKSIEKRLESIIESIAGNHWWKDRHGVYLGCNDAFIKTLGLNSSAEVIGKTDYELPWAETADYLIQNDQEVMNSGVACRREVQVTSKAGEILTFMVVKVPLRDEDGNIIGTVCNSIDITDQKKIENALIQAKEQAEEANLAKSNFLATVSHELRTPLNGILGMADILNREELNPHQKEFVKDIQSSGKNLLALMNDILDFSKLETGKMVLKIKTFNIKKLVGDIISSLSYQLEDKEIQLLYEFGSNVPDAVMGDQLRITQILVNLVGNSIKFTEEGSIKVKVTLNSKKNDIINLNFIIQDTGIGIPENKLDKIFDRFTQVETEHYNRRFGGVGLGLAICKQLVEMMGGHISVKSKLTKGSEFNFVIPIHLPADNIKFDKTVTVQSNIEKLLFDCYVLIVEDDFINQKIISTMLSKLGCQFDIADKGDQVLPLINKNNYDLIFLDIGLPDINGVALTKKIRMSQNQKYLPIIATTAFALEEEIKFFHEAGIDSVVTKPIEQEALRTILEKWVKNS